MSSKPQTLSLSNAEPSSAPIDIYNKYDMADLFLDNNQIDEIPAEIAQLKNLKTVSAYKNNLKTLPNEIFDLLSPGETKYFCKQI